MRRRDVNETKTAENEKTHTNQQSEVYRSQLLAIEEPYASNLCEVECSLCIGDWNLEIEELGRGVLVSEAMRTSVPWTATPSMDLLHVLMFMNRTGVSQVPFVLELINDQRGQLVGVLDRECISLTCSFRWVQTLAVRNSLSQYSALRMKILLLTSSFWSQIGKICIVYAGTLLILPWSYIPFAQQRFWCDIVLLKGYSELSWLIQEK